MKDDNQPRALEGSSPNAFEKERPGSVDRSLAEASIEDLRKRGGVFVEAVRATRMPMALTDPNLRGNPIVFANEAFLRLSGYRMEEVLGQQPHFMNGPDTDARDVARFSEAIRADQDDIVETVQYRKDGSRFIATVLLSAFKDDEGRTLNHFMSWLDVARRVDAEDELADLKSIQGALRQSEERFRLAIEGSKIALYECDEDLRYTWIANPAKGWVPSDIIGRTDAELLPPEHASAVTEFKRRTLKAAQPLEAEIEGAASGELRCFLLRAEKLSNHAGRPGGLRISALDVTELKHSERALRESEQKYRSLFTSMDEAYAVVEVLRDDCGSWSDIRFIEVNPAFTAHTSLADPVGKTATEILGNPNPRWAELCGRAIDSGEPLRVEESEHVLGRTFDLNIFSLEPQFNRVAVLFTDVTERKRAEEALQKSERHAKTLLAELQHRVRNIMGLIRSVARRSGDGVQDVDDFARHLEGRINAMARTQALLTRGVGATVDLQMLILDELATQTTRHEQYRLRGPDVALTGKAAEVLGLALHELTTNSVKYGALSNHAGRIDLRWSVRKAEKHRWLRLIWSEAGPTFEATPERRGFGTELITQRVPYELDGTGKLEFTPTGLIATIEFPLRDKRSILQTDEGRRRWA